MASFGRQDGQDQGERLWNSEGPLTDKTDPTYSEYWRGWSDCLSAVLCSLIAYPDAGGDIQIMAEVDRLIKEYGGDPDRSKAR